jgi:uncharacterized protein
MASRLADSTSTYLAQHAAQPVDWWPWSAAAFESARERDVPVLLSVGYASCHWCHVMAHESFSDPDTAAQLNAGFVPIKVDREERPDVDAVYMSATQALTGSGGWPMTCFLTADAEPFYAGTYYPPVPSSGLPSFRQLLTAISAAWAENRGEVLSAAGRISESLAGMTGALRGGTVGAAELAAAATDILDQIDPVHGGFAGAPKFPPAMAAEFLLRHHERTGSAEALTAVSLTLEQMARGGIFDQLGGGFSRYSVDRTWPVPHFEKMLDDNAQLLRLYAHHHRLTGSPLSGRVAEQVAEFLLRDLRLDSGPLAASLDADTEGVEGATYRWTPAEVIAVLGRADGAAAASLFALPEPADAGAGGPNAASRPGAEGLAAEVLRLPADPEDMRWFDSIRRRLLAVRDQRPQPGRDDIVVLRSNGLAITALAEAGAAMAHPDWVEAALAAADYLLTVHRVGGRWFRSSRHGRVGPGRAVLADLGDLASGLLAIYQAIGELRWLGEANGVIDHSVAHFADPDEASGEVIGFFDTADDAGPLLLRPRDPTDGAAPSGLSSIAHAALTAAALTGNAGYRTLAEAAVSSVAALVERFPRSAGWHLSAAEAMLAGPLQVAVAGPPGPARDELALTARLKAPSGSVVEVGRPDEPGRELLVHRPAIGGVPTAYVCRGFVCDRPVTSAAELTALLATD